MLILELTRVKGIGRWTAEMFLMFHLVRPDVLPLGGRRAAARDAPPLQRRTPAHHRPHAQAGRGMGAVALGGDVVSLAEPGSGPDRHRRKEVTRFSCARLVSSRQGEQGVTFLRAQMTHSDFVKAYQRGEIRVEIDPQVAARVLSARLLLPLVMMPVLGVGVALALIGWIYTGLAVIALGFIAPRLIKRSAPHFLLQHALRGRALYEELDAVRRAVARMRQQRDE